MRIAIAVPAYREAPDFGGPVTKVSLLASALAARGHTVTVLTSDLGPGRSRGFAGVRDYGDHTARYLKTFFHYRWSPAISPRELMRVPWDFDVVHVCGIRDGLSVGVTGLALRHRTPYVVEPLGMGPARLRNKWLKAASDFALTRPQLARARVVIATSARERNDLVGAFGLPNVQVRPNPLALEATVPSQKSPSSDDAPVEVLFVGRVCETKGLDLLVQAMRELPAARLTIAGPDDGDGTRQEVERLLAQTGGDRVTMRDWVDADERDRLIAASDICVLPSRTENFGNFAVEAARGRRPVVVTNTSGVSEVLGADAMVVDPTVEGLRAGIEKLMVDPSLRAQLADAGMECVRRLDPAVVAVQQDQIYLDAIAAAKR